MIAKTFTFARGADGLITLAATADEEHSYNPFSSGSNFISPDSAVWVLVNFDWPYERRANILSMDPPMPLVQQAVAARNLTGVYNPSNTRLMTILKELVDRGESIEDRWGGLTAVQSAILFSDVEVIQFLISQGADLAARTDRPGSKSDNLDSFELAELLAAGRFPESYEDTADLLRTTKNERQ